jgi:oligoendopeptidase F
MSPRNPLPTRRIVTLIAVLAATTLVLLPLDAADSPINWDLSDIYKDDAIWKESRAKLASKQGEIDQFRGRLGKDPTVLRQALDTLFALRMQGSALSSYASMRADEDLRESGPQGMEQSLRGVFADLQAATAWVDPEILEIPPAKLTEFLDQEPRLRGYQRYLERLNKQRPHVLDAESERLMGMTARIRGTGSTVGSLLRNAEIPWPTITLSDGTDLRVDPSGFVKGRSSNNREDRVATYEAFYNQLQSFKGSLAATLSATVQEHVFEARVREYESPLEASLSDNEVDTAVYHMLIREMNSNLSTLHRYLALRGRILGIEDLRYHDVYPPLVEQVDIDFSWDSSKKLVDAALVPLGEQYRKRFLQALDGGWVDVYPRPGKRSGAYVNDGAYEAHPYMLLNHQDDYLSTSTLAHEGGHLMHSWYSQEAQPFPTSGYSIFVAEVASTVNEVLLFRHAVAQATDDEERMFLLGSFLEGLRMTVFRQTMFAEFELAIHEAVDRGEPLTGDGLKELYAGLLRKYHGEAESVMKIDDLYFAEWAFVPHFHYNFYVYQYATSYIAATALAEGILEDRPGARERYLAFLKSGSTKPPVTLLQDAGVDMTTAEPIRAAMRLMNDVIDQIEEILERRGHSGS